MALFIARQTIFDLLQLHAQTYCPMSFFYNFSSCFLLCLFGQSNRFVEPFHHETNQDVHQKVQVHENEKEIDYYGHIWLHFIGGLQILGIPQSHYCKGHHRRMHRLELPQFRPVIKVAKTSKCELDHYNRHDESLQKL